MSIVEEALGHIDAAGITALDRDRGTNFLRHFAGGWGGEGLQRGCTKKQE